MSKSFTHAGVSTLKGVLKARFANDALRVKVLAKNGHTDIDIIELKEAMTKEDAVAYLLGIDFDNGNAAVRAALEAEVDKRTEKPKAEKAPKEITLDTIRARATEPVDEPAAATADATAAAELEDAPY